MTSPIKGILEILNLTPRCIPMDILAWMDCVRSSADITKPKIYYIFKKKRHINTIIIIMKN
jgi:hypothetical protein